MGRLKDRCGADVFVALDVLSLERARDLVASLLQPANMLPIPRVTHGYKLGLELCSAEGLPRLVAVEGEAPLFVDLKINDIPTTVGNTVAVVSKLLSKYGRRGIINIHAAAGEVAMRVAVDHKGGSLLFAVTALTSLSDRECEYIFGVNAEKAVYRFAMMARDAGVDGIICSPKDIERVRGSCSELLILTPGVRPTWAAANDQKRTATPREAILAGADGIVIGRPVTNPPEGKTPAEALANVLFEVENAFVERRDAT